MIEHNEYFKPFIPKENIKIWRYMDTAKFLELLDSSNLFFTNSNNFEDKHEGCFPIANFQIPERYNNNSKITPTWLLKDFNETFEYAKMFISCWHANDYESDGMWHSYLNNDFGVAIQSSFEKLTATLDTTTEVVNIGKVKYIDYENEIIDERNIHGIFLHKRTAFKHENELRALIHNRKAPKDLPGINVKIDLNSLIDCIYISPNAPSWYFNLIKNIIAKYGYNFSVKESKLNSIPINDLYKNVLINIKAEIKKHIITLLEMKFDTLDLKIKDEFTSIGLRLPKEIHFIIDSCTFILKSDDINEYMFGYTPENSHEIIKNFDLIFEFMPYLLLLMRDQVISEETSSLLIKEFKDIINFKENEVKE